MADRRGYRFLDNMSHPFGHLPLRASSSIPGYSHDDFDIHSLNDDLGISGHAAVAVGECIFIWGGCYETIFSGNDPQSQTHFRYSDQILMHCPSLVPSDYNNVWINFRCNTGDIPFPATGKTMVYMSGRLVIFGGFEARPKISPMDLELHGPVNSMHVLDLKTRRWRKVVYSDRSLVPSPRDKGVGWTYNDRPYFFTGYGTVPDSTERHFTNLSNLIVDFTSNGHNVWNNQLLTFDFVNNSWTLVESFGSVPCPRAAAACTTVDKGKMVFIFGGRLKTQRLNDLYVLDMGSLVWTQISMLDPPVGRSWSTLSATSDGKRIYLCGGYLDGSTSNQQLVSNDILEGNLETKTWTKVHELEYPRYWHSTFLVDGKLVITGGAAVPDPHIPPPDPANGDNQHVFLSPPSPILQYVRLQPKSLQRIALDNLPTEAIKTTRHSPKFVFLPVVLRELLRGRQLVDEPFVNYPLPNFIYSLGVQ